MKRIVFFVLIATAGFGIAHRVSAVSGDLPSSEDQGERQVESSIERTEAEECPDDVARGCHCPYPVKQTTILKTKVLCIDEGQTCGDSTVNYSCCVCDQPGKDKVVATFMTSASRQTYESCDKICKGLDPAGTINRQLGAGVYGPERKPGQPTPEQLHQSLAICFTAAECASAEYGGSSDAFRPGMGCPGSKGRCLAQEPQVKLSFPIGGVTTVQGFRGFVATMFRFIVGIVATAAAIMFLYGGFRYVFGSAFQNIQRAKEIMIDSLVGLAITLGALVILNVVNPETTTLKRLDVYLINKQQILGARYCTDVQTNKELLFAEAGIAPEYKDQNTAEFNISKDKTKCNNEYFADGFGNERCFGRLCEDKGSACVSCQSGLCKPGADPNGFECIKASFAGNILFTDRRHVAQILLFLVCNEPSVAQLEAHANSSPVANGVHDFKTAKLQQADTQTGQQGYAIDVTAADLEDARDECENEGGIRGFVLGMEYNDPGYSVLGVNVGGESVSANEYAAIGKTTCGSGPFAGYADIVRAPAVSMEYAILCGMATNRPLESPSGYWSEADFFRAVEATEPEPILCDFQLSDRNAPSDVSSLSSKYQIGDIECGIVR